MVDCPIEYDKCYHEYERIEVFDVVEEPVISEEDDEEWD